MDNGNTLLDLVDDTSDLFGGQNGSNGQMFNWADEFLGENEMDISGSVATKSGNLAITSPSNILLTSSNYAAASSIPTRAVSISTPYLQTSSLHAQEQQSTVMPSLLGQTIVNALQKGSGQSGLSPQVIQQGNQRIILKSANGNQIQLTQSQLQQHLLQQQTNAQTQHLLQQQTNAQTLQQISAPSSASPSVTMMNRSGTPNTSGLASVSLGLNSTQFQSPSPGPNVNIVHLPGNLNTQQHHQITQQPVQQTQQFQIAPGTILQIPGANTGIVQGHQTILGGQPGPLMNSQSTVIQNPNVVNVNVATHQAVLCSSPAQQQQPQQQQRFTQNPFNIQGTLIQTAEGKSILIPSQNVAQPINIQQWSMAQQMGQTQSQNPVGNMIQLTQSQPNTGLDSNQNQGLQQIVLNNQGQQILVQRAPTPSSQPQNIIVRTTSGQPGLVQIQQRSGQLHNAGQTQQAFPSSASNQQLKIVQQTAENPTGIPMINIGGQNISLQQLAGQDNIQGLQFIQQQQHQTQPQNSLAPQNPVIQQGHIALQQISNSQGQLTLQPQTVLNRTSSRLVSQGQSTNPGLSSQGQVPLHREQVAMQQNNLAGMSMQLLGNVSLQNQVNSHVQMSNPQNLVPVTVQTPQMSTDSSRNAQAQILLQQIQKSLKMSNSNDQLTSSEVSSQNASNVNLMLVEQENINKSPFSSNLTHSQLSVKMTKPLSTTVVSSSQNVPSVNLMVVKQENMDKMQFSACSTTPSNLIRFPFQSSAIKKEPDLIETLVKQEVPYSIVTTAQLSSVTSTVSQSIPMSLFTIGNTSGSVNTLSKHQKSSLSFGDSSVVKNLGSSELQTSVTSDVDSSLGQARPSATVQTIHLPPELQQQFQRVQLEMKKVHAATHLTLEQKQIKLRQLQVFQKKILLKGRVLATTKAEPHHIQQGLAALSQTGLNPSTSGLAHGVSTAVSSNQLFEQTPIMSVDCSNPIQTSTTVKDLLKSISSSDHSTTPPTNTRQTLLGNTNMGPAGLAFMNSSTKSSQALSALLATPSSSLTTPIVTATNQNLATSMSLSVNHEEQALPHLSAAPPQIEIPVSKNVVPASVVTSASPDVATPTQIKIANKVLTLSLTRAQRDKVQSYLDKMTPEQQQQYLQTQQGVLQRIQKQQEMNAQVRAQILAQKKQQALLSNQNQPSGITTVTSSKTPDSQIIKTEVKTIPVPSQTVPLTKPDSTGLTRGGFSRGQKRNYMDIPKGTLINQQIKQDQNHASNPDTKRPFKSRGDACRRLLRYHVFQSYGPTPEEFIKFDGNMNDVATELLQRKAKMFDRFRVLLLHETMRSEPSSELVMLQRMQNQDLRKVIEEEKELVNSDPDSFVPMPSKFLERETSATKIKKEDIKIEEDITSDIEDMDTTLVKSEPCDSDSDEKKKVKKLVIKTDGDNFRSSFKRKGLESPPSSLEGEESLNGSGGESASVDITLRHSQSIPNTDDEDTNEFGDEDRFRNIHEEAEQAALLISSAEESQDSQTEGMHSEYNGFSMKNSNIVQKTTNLLGNINTCEVTSESVYYDEAQSVRINTSRPSLGNYASVDDTGKYIPNHSPVSNVSSDNDVVMDVSQDPNEISNFDKFNMYQPITESLTDSEENSHYSADNCAEHNSIVIDDDDGHISKNNWKASTSRSEKMEQDVISSDPESDQEVKAQMESAINSILSLGQQSDSTDTQSIYSYNQSSAMFDTGRTNFEYTSTSNNQLNEMGRDTVQGLSEMNPFVVANDDGNVSDLELAVNSILM